MSDKQAWSPCQKPEVGDVLRWNEPLWAAPNKPRGKRDKIGEQQIIAQLITAGEFLNLKVISAEKISTDDAALKVKEGDDIRRKKTSLALGECHKKIT